MVWFFLFKIKKKTIVLFCFRTKVASTHGDHTVRVSDVATGKCLHILRGHPRTPWCIAFHPTSNQILASGCLGGEVRIWDLHVGVNFLHGRYTCICYHMFNKIYMGALLYHPMTCYDSGCEYGSVSCVVDQDLMDHIQCMYLTP